MKKTKRKGKITSQKEKTPSCPAAWVLTPRNESRWKIWCCSEVVQCSEQVLSSKPPALVMGLLWSRYHSLDPPVISARALQMSPAEQNPSWPGSALPRGVTVIPYGPYPIHSYLGGVLPLFYLSSHHHLPLEQVWFLCQCHTEPDPFS